MTNDRMALAELLAKGADSDLLREMIGCTSSALLRHSGLLSGASNWRMASNTALNWASDLAAS
jgi:hypothetical protein